MGAFHYLPDVVTLSLALQKCNGCGTCLTVCPQGVLAPSGSRVHIADRDACIECGACARNCKTGALRVEAGVGCAAAVINSVLGRDSSACCCSLSSGEGDDGASCC